MHFLFRCWRGLVRVRIQSGAGEGASLGSQLLALPVTAQVCDNKEGRMILAGSALTLALQRIFHLSCNPVG